jgi:hypothetical protein
MGEIFKLSRLVLAWLGPESEYSDVALDFVENLHFYQQTLPEMIRELSFGPSANSNSGTTALDNFLYLEWSGDPFNTNNG